MAQAPAYKVVAQNRRARFDYAIAETIEAGIMLTGSEVKSLRAGKSSINESFAGEMLGETGGGIFLFNANIPEYLEANRFNHEPKRPRKLLLHKRQINKFLGAIRRKGMTLVPMQVYFNAKGRIKVEIGLAKGKKTVDKRETIKERDWQRDKARILKGD
ncbi:SsrA-binding protein SmpB [Candidatus Finniella inopinata]|uniref:SsrA-binding protein n=1 Tax=Candidatus Finniella inopinata TaxID=1696036 RepID=A0A4Q7DLK0_9PROT|nr:SsrA-binding protein SmpB [Candidatus Finniella inopinata]RZI47054.1 SsrA-binding protein SmpB [Candidatus Finniella inopinata]